ncbi:MAG: hypothetical protein AVDCRST_MAG19-3260 [uncultured Thermomicrobiales bacterium]|uniref:Carbohydrate kinase PfkB domain-containing protein n=1 Tax=uncultured Thermomicrobiales bacterium TaxID=1645740 RepID=A0A6J4VFV5_9BACT|nr:MAG: hypothetical protein AVDCRST_MAG19-3260 [uncultured Thermomicrobiales bacterium]
MRTLDVVGLGFTSLDYLGLVPHLPRLDEGAPLLDFARQGGGPVAQALVTLSRLGASVGFVGRVGDDEAGTAMRAGLVAEGVDIGRLQVEPGATSGQCIILVDHTSGKRSICAHPGSAGEIDPTGLDVPFLCSGRYLHLDGHHSDAALVAARAARVAGVSVCLDAGGPDPRLLELVPLTDVLITGERFAAAAAPNGDFREGAGRLRAMGPRIVVVTRGEHGSFTETADGVFATPAFRVPVVDTTGAGDVFHGAYLFGLLRGWELDAVAEFASAAAAIKCGTLGGRAGIPRRAAVSEFLRDHGRRPPPAMVVG